MRKLMIAYNSASAHLRTHVDYNFTLYCCCSQHCYPTSDTNLSMKHHVDVLWCYGGQALFLLIFLDIHNILVASGWLKIKETNICLLVRLNTAAYPSHAFCMSLWEIYLNWGKKKKSENIVSNVWLMSYFFKLHIATDLAASESLKHVPKPGKMTESCEFECSFLVSTEWNKNEFEPRQMRCKWRAGT